MFDSIGGLPLHPLLIHTAVLAAPVTLLLALLFAFPRTRSWARWPLAIAGVGTVVGLVGALVATRVLRSLLFGVAPSDPVTFAGIVLVLGAAVLLASWIPARRAARVMPTEALREA